MKLITRLVALFFVVLATYFIIGLVPLSENLWFSNVVYLICAFAMGWFFWTRVPFDHDGVISRMFIGAVLVGGIGFTAGFLGPIVFTPEANQGPLLGIFITGPLGVVVGGFVGLVYWYIRDRKAVLEQ